jgi:predicted  nucleic acid-binding Zn-ribbon protein
MATKVYVITRERTNRDGTIKPSLTAVGVTAAIAAMQGKITEDQTALANAKTELAAAKDAASRLSWNKAISALEAAIKSWPSRIDLLNSAVTKIASAITMDQEQIALRTQKIKDAQTSQSELITRLQNTIATTKKTRALSCKVGL